MPNTKQNNEIEHINKEISLLQDRLKINEKSLNQFQNGLMQIGRIRVKNFFTKKITNFFQTKKIQNIVRNIFQNTIKQIKKMQRQPVNSKGYLCIQFLLRESCKGRSLVE